MDQSPRDESPDLISLEELEPSPETSGILDLESGIYTPGTESSPGNKAHGAPRPSSLRLGLGERGWDYWCMFSAHTAISLTSDMHGC